jgi:hypothetical protein
MIQKTLPFTADELIVPTTATARKDNWILLRNTVRSDFYGTAKKEATYI